MKDRSLVVFTISTQASAGMLAGLWACGLLGGESLYAALLPAVAAAGGFGLLGLGASFAHLGNPRNAPRALANLPRSWLSREVLLAGAYHSLWLVWLLAQASFGKNHLLSWVMFGGLAALSGLALVYGMSQVYTLRTLAAWKTPFTPVTFFITTGVLGGLGAAAGLSLAALAHPSLALWQPAAGSAAVALLAGGMRLASAPFLSGGPLRRRAAARLSLSLAAVGLSGAFIFMAVSGADSVPAASLAAVLALAGFACGLAAEVWERAVFYESRPRLM